jgi:hypothetical protein
MKNVAIVFVVLLVTANGSFISSAKSASNFLWNLKEKIPPPVREKASVIFGGKILESQYLQRKVWLRLTISNGCGTVPLAVVYRHMLFTGNRSEYE